MTGVIVPFSAITNEITVPGATDRYYILDMSGTPVHAYITHGNLAAAVVPDQSGNSGKILSTDGTDAVWVDRDWIAVSATWTRTGDHAFTVSDDVTSTYTKGRKVRYKDGGSYEYGVIASSSYSAPNTTVTLITNSSYAMASATITDTYLSDAQNPSGWPDWFNFSPTWAASGSMTFTSVTTSFCKWRSEGGKTIRYIGQGVGTTGGTASNTLTVTLPVNAAEGANSPAAAAWVADGGLALASACYASATLLSGRKADSSNFGLGTGRYFNFNAVYEF